MRKNNLSHRDRTANPAWEIEFYAGTNWMGVGPSTVGTTSKTKETKCSSLNIWEMMDKLFTVVPEQKFALKGGSVQNVNLKYKNP